MEKMEPGQRLRLTIRDVGFGGDGVGRSVEGQVVFVPFSAAGDEAEVEIVSVHRHFVRAEIREILTPGPGRAASACPHYGRCGGCRYQHLTHETELGVKVAQLQAVLQRIGQATALPEVDPIVRSPQPCGYRNKLRVEPTGPAFDTGKGLALEYGFCELDNKTFFPLDACPLAAPQLNELLPKAQRTAWARKNAARKQPGALTLRLAADGVTRLYFARAPRRVTWLHESLLDRAVSVPLGAFWQVNTAVAARLAETVATWFAEAPTPVLVDAYAGVGTFSLAVGEGAASRTLIERDEQAMHAASHNHRQWGLPGCECLGGDVGKLLPGVLKRTHDRGAPATVILDPPRSGCAPTVLRGLAESPASRAIYVSCNAATLARDLKALSAEGGFRISRLAFFDMFPRTAHFESAVLLQR